MKGRILVSLVIFLVVLLSIGSITLVHTRFLLLEIAFIALGIAFIGFMCGLLSQMFNKHA